MERSQQYQQARRIGRISLSDLIAKNIIEGKSIPGAVGASISQKFKAKTTRFKEKFDPLNIASALVGRSRLGTAILGRLMGRSSEDIAYFAKSGNRMGGSRNPFYTKIGARSREPVKRGDNVADVFSKVYSLMDRMEEQEKKAKEIQNNFREEQETEDERRHEELLEAITGEKRPTATKVEEKKGGGIFDFIKGMISNLMSFLDPFINIAKTIMTAFGAGFLSIITALGGFLLSPLGLGLLGLAGGIALSTYIAQQIGDFEKNKLLEKGGEKAVEAQKELMAAPADSPIQESYNEFGGTYVSDEAQIAAEKRDAAIKEKQDVVWRKMTKKGYPVRRTGLFGGITFEDKKGNEAPKKLVEEAGKEADLEIKQKAMKPPSATPVAPNKPATSAPESKPLSTNINKPATSAPESKPLPAGINLQDNESRQSKPIPVSNVPSVPPVESAMKQNMELNLQESGAEMSGAPIVINRNNVGGVNVGSGDTGTVTGAAPIRDDTLQRITGNLYKRASVM